MAQSVAVSSGAKSCTSPSKSPLPSASTKKLCSKHKHKEAGEAAAEDDEGGFSLKSCYETYTHASCCYMENCPAASQCVTCVEMKELLRHCILCADGNWSCKICRQIFILNKAHADRCEKNSCPILYCQQYRQWIGVLDRKLDCPVMQCLENEAYRPEFNHMLSCCVGHDSCRRCQRVNELLAASARLCDPAKCQEDGCRSTKQMLTANGYCLASSKTNKSSAKTAKSTCACLSSPSIIASSSASSAKTSTSSVKPTKSTTSSANKVTKSSTSTDEPSTRASGEELSIAEDASLAKSLNKSTCKANKTAKSSSKIVTQPSEEELSVVDDSSLDNEAKTAKSSSKIVAHASEEELSVVEDSSLGKTAKKSLDNEDKTAKSSSSTSKTSSSKMVTQASNEELSNVEDSSKSASSTNTVVNSTASSNNNNNDDDDSVADKKAKTTTEESSSDGQSLSKTSTRPTSNEFLKDELTIVENSSKAENGVDDCEQCNDDGYVHPEPVPPLTPPYRLMAKRSKPTTDEDDGDVASRSLSSSKKMATTLVSYTDDPCTMSEPSPSKKAKYTETSSTQTATNVYETVSSSSSSDDDDYHYIDGDEFFTTEKTKQIGPYEIVISCRPVGKSSKEVKNLTCVTSKTTKMDKSTCSSNTITSTCNSADVSANSTNSSKTAISTSSTEILDNCNSSKTLKPTSNSSVKASVNSSENTSKTVKPASTVDSSEDVPVHSSKTTKSTSTAVPVSSNSSKTVKPTSTPPDSSGEASVNSSKTTKLTPSEVPAKLVNCSKANQSTTCSASSSPLSTTTSCAKAPVKLANCSNCCKSSTSSKCSSKAKTTKSSSTSTTAPRFSTSADVLAELAKYSMNSSKAPTPVSASTSATAASAAKSPFKYRLPSAAEFGIVSAANSYTRPVTLLTPAGEVVYSFPKASTENAKSSCKSKATPSKQPLSLSEGGEMSVASTVAFIPSFANLVAGSLVRIQTSSKMIPSSMAKIPPKPPNGSEDDDASMPTKITKLTTFPPIGIRPPDMYNTSTK